MSDDPSATPGAAGQDAPLSQADIDAALAGTDQPTGKAPLSDAGRQPLDRTVADDTAEHDSPVEPGEAESAGPLSQADVDAALGGAGEPGPGSSSAAPGGAGEISQDDIDALLAASLPEGSEPSQPAHRLKTGATYGRATDERVDTAGRPFDAAAAAMAAAIEEERAAAAAQPTQALKLPDFSQDGGDDGFNHGIELLQDVSLRVKIELGRTSMLVEDVLRLGEGSVLELDKLAGDPVDVFANDRLIARGEVLVLNDNFCVRVGEIITGRVEDE